MVLYERFVVLFSLNVTNFFMKWTFLAWKKLLSRKIDRGIRRRFYLKHSGPPIRFVDEFTKMHSGPPIEFVVEFTKMHSGPPIEFVIEFAKISSKIQCVQLFYKH